MHESAKLDEFARVIAERNKAFINFDLNYVRRTQPAIPEHMLDIVLHKARYECTQIPAQLRHKSYRWLKQGGWKRMTGTALLPEGELPA